MLRKIVSLLLVAALTLSLAACGSDPVTIPTVTEPTVNLDTADMFTDRDMDPSYDSCVSITLSDAGCAADGAGVTIDGTTVTVTQGGTYRLSGKLTAGQIRVAAGETDKVQLVLDGASVANEGHAALYVLSCDKVFVTLTEDTENALAASGEFIQTDDNSVDAALFSKSDVVINGSGSLAVLCETAHGIVSKDDLKITGGGLHVTAAKQGISGKDSVRIAGGSITVEAGTDGIRSKNTEDTAKGYVYIRGGSFDIKAGNDGISASASCLIEGGAFEIFTGEGSASVTHSDGQWGGGMMPGWGGMGGGTATEDTESIKGIKAAAGLTVSGGSFTVDAEDDALHSNADLTVTGGSFAIASGDDAFHADGSLFISGGAIDISKSYEGLEGNYITVSGGDIRLVSSDDGINAAGGNDASGMAGPFGGGMGGFGEATDAYILIAGGNLVMNAGGDGVDSNGDLTVTGGTVYLDGPTNSGNGALDYAGNAKITGGVFIALGAAGMAMNFGTDSTQGAILCSLNGNAPAGTEVSVKDSNGNVLASYVSQKSYQSILISAPGMEKGQTYTVSVGEATAEFTLDSIIYGSGSGMGGPGGMGGGRPGGGRPGK